MSESISRLSTAAIVPFIGKPYAFGEQQVAVWMQLDLLVEQGSAIACTVLLSNTANSKTVPFASKARPTGSKGDDVDWTADEKKSNLVTMKKLWRWENAATSNEKRRVSVVTGRAGVGPQQAGRHSRPGATAGS